MLTRREMWQDAAALELEMLKQTMNSVLGIMKVGKFRNFPNDYLVIDVETTGVRFHKDGRNARHWDGDFITELGYCYVKDGVSTGHETLVLNWASVPKVNRQALNERMETTRRQMEFKDGKPTGRTYHMSLKRMEEEGADPIEVLQSFAEILQFARESGNFFVAHNGYHFDGTMFENHFDYWCKSDFKFGDNEMFDTGMVEKGSRSAMVPWLNDSVRSWSNRTYAVWLKGVHWALDRACVPRYNLAELYNLDMSQAHGAGFDCYVTHCLFEEFKKIACGDRVEPPIYVPV